MSLQETMNNFDGEITNNYFSIKIFIHLIYLQY